MRRLLGFWGFAGRWRLQLKSHTEFDNACTDWADFQFLDGEGPSEGEKLKAAPESWAVSHWPTGALSLPRFSRVLRSCRKNHPKRSRLPMPEEYHWAMVGWLASHVSIEAALYQATLFPTYLGPGALLGLYAANAVPPTQGISAGDHHVLVVSPFEKEISTKSGYYDETVVLDGDICPPLGKFLFRHAESMMDKFEGEKEDAPLWNLSARDYLADWRCGSHELGLEGMETLYQARHGGASRDFLLRRRTAGEIMLGGVGGSVSSMRLYNKPGRIQKLVNALDPTVVAYSGDIKENFEKYVLSGTFPVPPVVRRRSKRKSVF